jgi:hypothetical protein
VDYPVTPPIQGWPKELLDELVPHQTPSGRPLRRLTDRPLASTSDAFAFLGRGEIVHPTAPPLLAHFGHPDPVLVPIEGMPPLRSAMFWRSDANDPRIDAFAAAAKEVVPPGLDDVS